jgi:hypothetical protein
MATNKQKSNSSIHILSDRLYCCDSNPSFCLESGEPQSSFETQCKDYYKKKMNAKNSEAALHNVPLIISEFGSCSNSDDCTQDINNVLDVCEESLTGWAYN